MDDIELEPFSTLIKLAILYYKIEGTKISIYNNSISYESPTFYQGFVRYMYSSGREDLKKLELPIKIGLIWVSKNYLEHNNIIKNILKKSINGLLKLSRCYQQDLDTYRLILSLSQLINNYVYDDSLSIIEDNYNINRVWSDFEDIKNITDSFEKIEKYTIDNHITNLDVVYDTIDTFLVNIENCLKKKDVIFISKLNYNNLIMN